MCTENAAVAAPPAALCYRAGNMQGRYFTQWRVDLLVELLEMVRERGFVCDDAEIWYDEPSDFHYLSFIAGGKVFAVRFYKVFSMSVNGVDNWAGILRSRIVLLADHIAEVAR